MNEFKEEDSLGHQSIWRQVVYLIRIRSYREALQVAFSPITGKKQTWSY